MVTIPNGNTKKHLSIPLPNDTLFHQISRYSTEQLVEKMRNKPFAIQIDEAMDSTKVLIS